jgi:hypothetical protein
VRNHKNSAAILNQARIKRAAKAQPPCKIGVIGVIGVVDVTAALPA